MTVPGDGPWLVRPHASRRLPAVRAGLRSADEAGPSKPPQVGPTTLTGVVRDMLRVELTLAFIGTLLYIVIITTFVAKIADILMGIALFGLLVSGRRLRMPPPVVAFLGLLIWSLVTLPGSKYLSVGLDKLSEFGKVGLIFLAIVNSFTTPRQVRAALAVYLGSYLLYPARGTLFNYFLYGSADFGRAAWQGAFSNPNDMATLTIFPLSLAIGYLMTASLKPMRQLAAIAVVLLGVAVLLTQSRGGVIGCAVFLALVLMTQARNRLRSIAIAACLAAVVVVVAPGGVWERVAGLKKVNIESGMAGVDQEGSAAERWKIWQTAGRMIEDHPFAGVGFGTYKLANLEYSPWLGPRDTHNTYLNFLAEVGPLGLALFLAIVFYTLRQCQRARRAASDQQRAATRRLQLAEFALVGYLVSGIWGTYGKISLLYVHLGFLWCMSEVSLRWSGIRTARATSPAGPPRRRADP